MSCTICNHPQRRAIDQALVAGSAPLAELAKQYNLGPPMSLAIRDFPAETRVQEEMW